MHVCFLCIDTPVAIASYVHFALISFLLNYKD